MDKECPMSPEIQQGQNELMQEREEISQQHESRPKQNQENKVVRRPGRPPLRINSRQKNIFKSNDQENQNDEYCQHEKPKLKQKNYSGKQDKQNGFDSFIKIIDYLKKIQCDETSLHNKMNPYNLLTPTCFWYMISAEYFSFDFFNSKNPQEVALEFLRRAEKTQIILPTRVLKPLKLSTELEFQTQQIRQLSAPLTQKLTNLTNNIPFAPQPASQTLQKSTFLTSVAEDNEFRSSIRAVVFNWINKKISFNEKWSSVIKPKLESASKIPSKTFASRIFYSQEEKKHEQLDVAPQIYYRQRKIIKNPLQIRRNRQPKKLNQRQKKNSKKQKQKDDQIYDESQSQQIKKQEQIVEQKYEQKQQIEVQKKEENEGIDNEYMDDEIKIDQYHPTGLQPPKSLKRQENQMQNQDEHKQIPSDQKNVQLANMELFQQQGQQNGQLNEEGRENEKQQIFIQKNYNEDDLLLNAIMHMPLDNIISILKSSIQTPQLHQIQKPFMPTPKNDPLQLVYQIHPDEEVFLNYMKQRQQKMYLEKTSHTDSMIEEKQREGQVEDAKCQVCTDGDYTEDNLIVFCSMCNISLHQRCVGLAKVPADNWICQVCSSFGPAGINVPCPLCHVKGGALKRTSIHINTPIFKDTNPQYHEFAKKCPNYKHKQQYINQGRIGGRGEEQPYYDYFLKQSYPEDMPVCHFVWVHYVCAIWIPQCYFQQKNGLINIKGIQNIDKRRFKQKCLICKQAKAGACVKCDNQNCTKYYHPECARKKRIYMEQLNLDKLKYLIFCEAHEPLKVKRKIQIKKKKQRDEIIKFCRGIQKYVETYKIANLSFKLLKVGINTGPEVSKYDSNKKQKVPQGEQKIMIKMQKNTDQDFIKSVIDGLLKQNQIIVNLNHLGNNRYKVEQVIKPSKRDMRKSLTRLDQFWKNFKNSESPENNLKRFNAIMRENNYLKQKIQNFINFGSNADERGSQNEGRIRRNMGRRRKQYIQTVIEQHGALFCVCRKPYNGEDDMFECEVCNQWYHHQCIGFIGSEDDAQKLVFHCMKCLKYQSGEQKKQLLDKCAKFFSQDSLYLNYRPPTPSLQSDEQQIKNNYSKNENQKKCQGEPKQNENKNLRGHKQRPKYHLLNQSLEDQINVQRPFIVFDPSLQSIQKIINEKMEEEVGIPDENKNQKLLDKMPEPEDKEQQSEQKAEHEPFIGIVKSPTFGQNRNVQNQSRNSQVLDVSIVGRTLSNQSQQLLTPEFRPSIVSFGPIEQGQKDKKLSLEQSNKEQKIEQIEHRSQGSQNQNQNENKMPNIEFQYNRMEIQKLKNSIAQEQNEKLQNQLKEKQKIVSSQQK